MTQDEKLLELMEGCKRKNHISNSRRASEGCSLWKEPKVMFISFGAKETNQRKHSPHQGLPSRGGCNRSSCRSYTNVSSTHHRVGMFLSTTLDVGRLTLVDDVSVGWDHPLDL